MKEIMPFLEGRNQMVGNCSDVITAFMGRKCGCGSKFVSDSRSWVLVAMALLMLFSDPRHAGAQDASIPEAGELKLVTTDPVFLHQNLQIKATGSLAGKLLSELFDNAADRRLTLFLSGVELKGLRTAYWTNTQNSEVTIQFDLQRNPSNAKSRAAWDRLLENIDSSLLIKAEVALAVGKGHPYQVTGIAKVGLASANYIRIILVLGLVGFPLVLVGLGVKSNILKDGGEDGSYSLGRTQMAFWGLLVLFAWVGTSFITKCMEHVPQETLILLGISATTGLGALAVGDHTKVKKQTRTTLETEKKELLRRKEEAAPEQAFSQASEERLAQINHELALMPELGPTHLMSKPSGAKRTGWNKFFYDLCSDENGLSFHRLQVVLWTIALGVFFAWRVKNTLSMPAFSETLLILMGVSNGTYIGFKFSERQ